MYQGRWGLAQSINDGPTSGAFLIACPEDTLPIINEVSLPTDAFTY